MENKYYTPEIEEFYFGFECETYVTTSRTAENSFSDWYSIVFGNLTTVCEKLTIGELIHKQKLDVEKFRVKYLDKEDIESLDWKFKKDMGNGNLYSKGNYNLFHHIEDNLITIIVKDPSLDLSMMVKLVTKEVHMITIKNKSELKKLLKQLNVK